MVAVSTSTVAVPSPAFPQPAPQPPPQSSVAPAPANNPVDTVTLSDEAQQILDGQAPPPVTPAPAVLGAPAPPSQDQITAAVTALNDTSGKTSLDDQLKAYAMLSNLVAKGQVLFDNRLPPANPPPGGTIKASDAQALLVSPFSQHLNQVVAQVDGSKATGVNDNGYDLANVIDKGLATFDALSAADQQTYVAAKNVYNSLVSQQAPIASVADYRANQQAQANVDRAMQAAQDNPAYASSIQTGAGGEANNFTSRREAMALLAQAAGDQASVALAQLARTDPGSDAFTQAAQAYFAKYGPAPGPHAGTGQGFPQAPAAAAPPGYSPPDIKTLMDALAKVDDTSGGVMATDQVAAMKLLNGYAAYAGPAGVAVVMNATASAYAQRTAQTQTLVEKYLVPGKDPYPQMLDHLNALSPEDQTTYFGASSTRSDGTVLFASLDSLKQNLTTRETVLQLYTAVTKAYGVQDLSHFTTRAAKDNPALKQLEALFRADQGNDAWTAMAEDFLNNTTPADLGLTPVDDKGNPDAAKALQTLKEISDSQMAFAVAVKSGHAKDWNPITEAKKAKAKADAAANAKALTASVTAP